MELKEVIERGLNNLIEVTKHQNALIFALINTMIAKGYFTSEEFYAQVDTEVEESEMYIQAMMDALDKRAKVNN